MLIGKCGVRCLCYLILFSFFFQFFSPNISIAQNHDCLYDKENPSLENARISFKSLNYICAEKELLTYLNQPFITTQQKADVYALMAAVYYAMTENETEKKSLVIESFKKTFRMIRDWKGDLDVTSSEFSEWMNQAKFEVDHERQTGEVVTNFDDKGKWYKKWWAIALGVGVVAGAAVILAGGGDDEPLPSDSLPSFPTSPNDSK